MEKTAQIAEHVTPDVDNVLEKVASADEAVRLERLDCDVRKALIEHVVETTP